MGILVLLSCVIALALSIRLIRPQLRLLELALTRRERTEAEERLDAEEHCPSLPPQRQYRVNFGSGPGVSVTGWPGKGGLYVLGPCFAVELDFLQLDRFRRLERPSVSDANSKAEEEAHCDRCK